VLSAENCTTFCAWSPESAFSNCSSICSRTRSIPSSPDHCNEDFSQAGIALVSAGPPIECWAGHTGGTARPAPASAEHKPVAAADEHELTKTEVHGSSPQDQYDGNFRLFLGNDLADRGEAYLADT
jgi:hypothetical protein